ncbi:hypothetical protein CWI84_02975 [Idiomarina tyrosinivorans]|uniref:Uncharacterized protein n=1 Tax=Idiomarina tyrosinivorans TaxID=1445662 RepID=A0A432ZT65_9GAMM|nr:hypothetical protein [Idiomarina tyrosinivorans]RUO81089.1 hypothetical protein CWI84_02975 [Idiomarina tyrosinivorans]
MNKDEQITLKLSEISGYHPKVAQLVAKLADRSFTASIADLSEQAAEHFLRIHPICISRYRGKFFVVAGFRAFQVAELLLNQTTILRFSLINSKSDILDIARTDILFSPLIFSLSTKVAQQTGRLIEIVGTDFTNEHHSDLASERSRTRFHTQGQ